MFTTSATYPWSFVTQIFHSGQPSHGGDRNIFEVMTSTIDEKLHRNGEGMEHSAQQRCLATTGKVIELGWDKATFLAATHIFL